MGSHGMSRGVPWDVPWDPMGKGCTSRSKEACFSWTGGSPLKVFGMTELEHAMVAGSTFSNSITGRAWRQRQHSRAAVFCCLLHDF